MKAARNNIRRTELADFLRNKRHSMSPGQVGLPGTSRRRRAPGLRREEVAALAGVGISWYTWLEQARDISVSAAVARGLATVLQLSTTEARYLYNLLGLAIPVDIATVRRHWSGTALALDHLWNIVDLNESAEYLLGIPSGSDNLLKWLFAIPNRTYYSAVSRNAVSRFRTEAAAYIENTDVQSARGLRHLRAVLERQLIKLTTCWRLACPVLQLFSSRR